LSKYILYRYPSRSSEVSVREWLGQPLSLAKIDILGASAVAKAKVHSRTRERERLDSAAEAKNLACAQEFLTAGN
jgi:hypothetical protein